MKTILLIDLSGLYWVLWHASKDAELSTAYERTLAKVASLANGFDHVAICADRGPYKRKEMSAAYKAQRDEAPPLAVEQLERVKRRLEADGHLIWECKGYEADDVIATACMGLSDHEVTIASADKDLLALVNDEPPPIRVVSPFTNKLFGEYEVREKFGVSPRQMPDLLALMGDKSDNVEGVRGVGEKTGAALLNDHGDLEAVLAAPLTGKIGEAVKAAADTVRLGRKLVTLMLDAPINVADIFEKRDPKPLGPPGDWDEAQFDEVLPPVKGKPEPAEQTKALAIPPKVQTIVARPVEWSSQLEPSSANEAFTVAKYFEESRLYPNLGSRAALFTVILRGRALGLDAATSCAMFHVVEGRPVMHAELIVGLVMRSGKATYFRCLETDDMHAVWATRRVGDEHEVRIAWDMERALRAGLVTKGPKGYQGVSRSGRATNWDKYPRTMLRWRAATELAHAVYPEVVAGLMTPDEASEGMEDAAE